MNKTVFFHDLGLTDYRDAWQFQRRLFDRIVARKLDNRTHGTSVPTENHLLLTEHPPVYTLGKHGNPAHLLFPPQRLAEEGIEVFRTDRGGDITFHGPGQIVGYPVLDLDNFTPDIHLHVHRMEETVIRTLADYGIRGGRVAGRSGVWLDPGMPSARKICAVGVRASRWVTMHGFALNVNTDLEYFTRIVPCGISDSGVTSLAREKGTPMDIHAVREVLLQHFALVFGCRIIPVGG